jgi:hypothetical protein
MSNRSLTFLKILTLGPILLFPSLILSKPGETDKSTLSKLLWEELELISNEKFSETPIYKTKSNSLLNHPDYLDDEVRFKESGIDKEKVGETTKQNQIRMRSR